MTVDTALIVTGIGIIFSMFVAAFRLGSMIGELRQTKDKLAKIEGNHSEFGEAIAGFTAKLDNGIGAAVRELKDETKADIRRLFERVDKLPCGEERARIDALERQAEIGKRRGR